MFVVFCHGSLQYVCAVVTTLLPLAVACGTAHRLFSTDLFAVCRRLFAAMPPADFACIVYADDI